jgi:hypothetical protein
MRFSLPGRLHRKSLISLQLFAVNLAHSGRLRRSPRCKCPFCVLFHPLLQPDPIYRTISKGKKFLNRDNKEALDVDRTKKNDPAKTI